jgi:hypothetical protein
MALGKAKEGRWWGCCHITCLARCDRGCNRWTGEYMHGTTGIRGMWVAGVAVLYAPEQWL